MREIFYLINGECVLIRLRLGADEFPTNPVRLLSISLSPSTHLSVHREVAENGSWGLVRLKKLTASQLR